MAKWEVDAHVTLVTLELLIGAWKLPTGGGGAFPAGCSDRSLGPRDRIDGSSVDEPLITLPDLVGLLLAILYFVLYEIMKGCDGANEAAKIYCHELVVGLDAHRPG